VDFYAPVGYFAKIMRPDRYKLLAAGILLVLPLSSRAAERRWTADDLVQSERITGLDLSPTDPQVVVWVKAAPQKDQNEFVSHLFRSTDGEGVVQLTRGKESCDRPRFSPDSRRIAFLSERPLPKDENVAKKDDESKTQIWLLDGGEPYPVTEFPRKVQAFAWRETNCIVFTAQEPPPQRERDLEGKKDKSRVVEDESNEPPVRLFEIDLKTRKVTRLTTNHDRITALFVSGNGQQAVTFHNQSLRFDYDNQIRPQYFLTNPRTGERRRIFADRRFNLKSVVWAPDGQSFYAVNDFTTHPKYLETSTTEVWLFELASGKESLVELDWDRGLEAQAPGEAGFDGILTALPDGFLTLLADGVRPRAARYARVGGEWRRAFLEGAQATNLFALRAGFARGTNAVAYLHSAADTPPQLFLASLNQTKLESPRQLGDLNPNWKDKPKARVETVHWKGARGDSVEGLLYYPYDYQSAARRPLVLVIHGGPFWADFDAWRESWHFAIQPHCERGAFVLRVNYHGSSSYGREFAESIAGGTQYYDLPVEDIERGVDALVERGLVDPDKVGTLGWSNGAILTLALLTRNPGRYKAAAAGAGGFEWIADTSITSFGQSFNDYYFGKMPWEDPELYLRVAPYYQADRITTPLLIFHGDADTSVPVHHGWMQFRALQQRTKTPVRFVIFPGEEHALKKLSNMRRKIEEELAWFEEHLYRNRAQRPSWLKDGSPIASLVARGHAKHDGARLGLMAKGKLIPEVVLFSPLTVGRFEVTRAQFAEFKTDFPVPPLHENFPATGVTFEDAKAYCAWLSRLTGETWRLPTETEAEKLYETRDLAENTLDHWAGYAPNAEDAERLLATVKPLGLGSLVCEVGSFAGVGDDPVFDLGGNAAEWVALPNGTGRLAGGSADQPKEPYGPSKASPEFTGLRVIRE